MTKNLRYFTLCFVVFSIIIDRGDGRWKRKDREKLEKDIVIFRKMAENIEHDIEDFYDDYPDEERLDRNPEDAKLSEHMNYDKGSDNLVFESLKFNAYNHSYVNHKEVKIDSPNQSQGSADTLFTPVTFKLNEKKTNYANIIRKTTWPKFEDMLLAIGKRYDWKNDRWIKVKDKTNKKSLKQNLNYIRSDFLSKHKFNYRTVKLNRSKSKRNVIIAVKAVR